MFFGLKSTPLVWDRLAAALMRLLRGCVNVKHTQFQGYMDDPDLLLRGTKTARDKFLSSLCLHTTTVDITMAWHKGTRGPDLEQIETCSNRG